jgi:hypothetical protein
MKDFDVSVYYLSSFECSVTADTEEEAMRIAEERYLTEVTWELRGPIEYTEAIEDTPIP